MSRETIFVVVSGDGNGGTPPRRAYRSRVLADASCDDREYVLETELLTGTGKYALRPDDAIEDDDVQAWSGDFPDLYDGPKDVDE